MTFQTQATLKNSNLNPSPTTNNQPPCVSYRVLGSLQNFPEFARAFNCNKSSPMVPDNICRVWWSTDLWDGDSSDIVVPVPLYAPPLPTPDCCSTRRGHGEVQASLSSLLIGTGLVDWHCSMHFLWGKQWTVASWTGCERCLSYSDTVVHSISLILLLLTGFVFLFSIFALFYSSFATLPMWVWVSLSQNTVLVERGADRRCA